MLSIPHMIVVFVVVLIVFGPQKLPELARGLGKILAEFRKASTDFKFAFEEEMRDIERQAREVERRKAEAAAAATAASQPMPATQATPPESETHYAANELAAGESETRATEAPVITPVAESVARSDELSQASEPDAVKTQEHSADGNTPEDKSLELHAND